MKKLFFFLFLLSYLTSCVVEKRVYNKGFYVHKKSTYNLQKKQGQFEEENFVNEINAVAIEDTLLTSTSDIAGNLENSSPCDTIIFVNGDTLYGNVIILNDRWIAIDDCDSILVKKPSFNRSSIHEIHYASGDTERITERTPYQQEVAQKRGVNKTDGKEYVSKYPHFTMFATVLFLLLASIFLIAVVLGNPSSSVFLAMLLFSLNATVFGTISLIYHLRKRKKKYALLSIIIEFIVLGVTTLAFLQID
ncbi:MAG: hypothetical protein IT221_02285 [Fluviicola sp.]|nr:hypothetical protein [Fluviicola sp.]